MTIEELPEELIAEIRSSVFLECALIATEIAEDPDTDSWVFASTAAERVAEAIRKASKLPYRR